MTIDVRLHDGEPYFLLRAQDLIAPCIVQLYALHLTSMYGVPKEKIASVRKVVAEMRKWQAANAKLTKLPD